MAGMLAGVDHARGRRTMHHLFGSNCRDIIRHHQRIDTFSTMDEAALKARRRLEEKLRGLPPSSDKRNKLQTNKSNNSSEGRSSKPANKEARKDPDHEVVPVVGSTKFAHLKRMNSQREEVCSICLEEFGTQRPVMNLPCFHKYHSDCLLPWLAKHSHCPYCRTHVRP
ncbi:probable E3 ubiquitin-protein ligase RHY1A [Papaver somniferum]|uniref:probable E3 ubiquitin-protein ligase RHY1A n=1 Tax=Papaver somniferum TaxID=3469 RepID=UPI000E702901|nr:probable E3 ubiquitin-protein ligase RHY1A [Papaver somniferum]